MTFEDRLKRSLERALGSTELPGGDLGAMTAQDNRVRRNRRRRGVAGAVAGVVVVAVGVAALSQAAGGGRADLAPPGSQRSITCAGEMVRTTPQQRPRVPAYETPREAALGWAGPDPGRLELDGDDYAYLLRDDGSVRARMRLESTRADLEDREPTSWSVDGSQTCADEVSAQEWQYADDLQCLSSERAVVASVRYERDDDDRWFPTEPEAFKLDARHGSSIRRTVGSGSGDATALTSHDGRVHTVVRLLRVADLWRVVEIAECSSQAPGLASATEEGPVEVFNLRAGHCWLDTLRYDGRSWEAQAKDDFGSGGAIPTRWHGIGTIDESGDVLNYVDLGGAEVTLLPSGDPGIADKQFCS